MAYDPQKNHRRPSPAEEGPAPVDALIADSDDEPRLAIDDPPVAPAVTPPVADPPPDAVVVNTGLAAAIGAAITLLVARYLWRRRNNGQSGQ